MYVTDRSILYFTGSDRKTPTCMRITPENLHLNTIKKLILKYTCKQISIYEIASMFPWFVLTFKKFEALWYCQSIEMLRVFKLSKHFPKIWDCCYKSNKKFGWNWIYLHNIIRKRCESLYSGCSSIWGVHSPIFVASVGGRADFRAALLANGLPQKVKVRSATNATKSAIK